MIFISLFYCTNKDSPLSSSHKQREANFLRENLKTTEECLLVLIFWLRNEPTCKFPWLPNFNPYEY